MSASTPMALQHRIDEMQSLRLADQSIPTATPLRPLLPGGALRKGGAYAVQGSTTLGLALLAEASTAGEWCGVVGMPSLNPEAAAELGVALDRCALVPQPGERTFAIASTLAETLSLVLVHDFPVPDHRDAARLAAKLRDSGAALIVLGDWPRTESELRVTASHWSGLGQGRGLLRTRELTVRSRDRRGTRQHTLRLEAGGLGTPEAAPKPKPKPKPKPMTAPRALPVNAPETARRRAPEMEPA